MLLTAAAIAPIGAHAGRPSFTDDAGLLDQGACQLEAWAQRGQDRSEHWALPACNVTGNLELALGGVRVSESGARDGRGLMQVKTLFKPLVTNGWGIGLAIGNEFGAATERPLRNRLIGDVFAHVPLSFSFDDDRVELHANVGWMREREARRDRATWAVASVFQVSERTALIAESFGRSSERPLYNIGLRYWLIPERLQLDASHGSRFGSGSTERFLTVGFVLFTDPLLR